MPMRPTLRAVPVMDQDRNHSSISWDCDRGPVLELWDGGNAVCWRFTFPEKDMDTERKRGFRMKHVLDQYVSHGLAAARAWAKSKGATHEVDRLAERVSPTKTPEMALYEMAAAA